MFVSSSTFCHLLAQIYKGDPTTCTILILAWGSNWGSLGFSRNQNNHCSSGAYATCIYCGLSVKINSHKILHDAQRSWTHLLCVCFCACGQQNPKTPNLSPNADDAITLGGIQGLGSSTLYICSYFSSIQY